jgi:hypothetical protein
MQAMTSLASLVAERMQKKKFEISSPPTKQNNLIAVAAVSLNLTQTAVTPFRVHSSAIINVICYLSGR